MENSPGQKWQNLEQNARMEQVMVLPLRWGKYSAYKWWNDFFLVGTSTGLFSTDTLINNATVWSQQGPSSIGSAVVDMIETRTLDGLVAVAFTHEVDCLPLSDQYKWSEYKSCKCRKNGFTGISPILQQTSFLFNCHMQFQIQQ